MTVSGRYDLCEVTSDMAFPQKSFLKRASNPVLPWTSGLRTIAGMSSWTKSFWNAGLTMMKTKIAEARADDKLAIFREQKSRIWFFKKCLAMSHCTSNIAYWTGFGIKNSNWDFASPKCKHSKDKIVVHIKQNMTFFIFYKSKLLHWTMYVTNYNSFETPIVGSKIRGYKLATS